MLGIACFEPVPGRSFGAGTLSRWLERAAVSAILAAILALALALLPASSQARDHAPPRSMTAALAPVSQVDRIAMPAVDAALYLREDEEAARLGTGGPARFAAPLDVDLDTHSDGTWEELNDGSWIWRLRVLSPGALSLNFGFTRFHLPPGAAVHIYPSGDAPGAEAWAGWYAGPFTAANADPEGGFWTPVIPGDEAIIELYTPPDPEFEPYLRLGRVSHDYRGFGQMVRAALKQGDCNNDVICQEGDSWRDEIRSVGCYSLNGSLSCTGTLVNSHDPERPPYFLTAYHCSVSEANDQSMVVYWNFESPSCGQLCCGSFSQNQTGSELLSKYSASDFCLVRLSQEPDSSFHVYYAGWDAREDTTPQEAVAIHHPSCDEKAISFTQTPLTVTSYLRNPVPGDGTHWRIHHWDDGTTEPGSSGSGLWNPEGRIVGQLHGGYASCTSLTSDWYGRLSVSWEGGGTAETRLRDWLDPAGTGGPVLDGWDPAGSGGGLAGDANLDGVVNVQDAVVMVNHILGTEVLTGDALANADRDADGEVSVLDLVMVVNIVLGLAPPGGPEAATMEPVMVRPSWSPSSQSLGLVFAWDRPPAAVEIHLAGSEGGNHGAEDGLPGMATPVKGLEGSGWTGAAVLHESGELELVLYSLSPDPELLPEVLQIPVPWTSGAPRWIGGRAVSRDGREVELLPQGFLSTVDGEQDRSLLVSVEPNPFRTGLSLQLRLLQPGLVQAELYDAAGRIRAELPAQALPAGTSSLSWPDWRMSLDESGVYFLRVSLDGRPMETRRVVKIR